MGGQDLGRSCAKPDDQGCCGLHAYGRAKLANLAYTLDLAQRLKGDGISVFAADVVAPWLRPEGPWSLTFGPTLTVSPCAPIAPDRSPTRPGKAPDRGPT